MTIPLRMTNLTKPLRMMLLTTSLRMIMTLTNPWRVMLTWYQRRSDSVHGLPAAGLNGLHLVEDLTRLTLGRNFFRV